MLSNFDYLWKRLLCVCVCVNSTFGRCCHCPCEKEEVQEQFCNKEENKYAIESIKNTNDDKKNLINPIIGEAIKNDVICKECGNTKDSESKIKFVYADPGSSSTGHLLINIVNLEFGFCKDHKKCFRNDCVNEAEYLFKCGHQVCQTHYEDTVNEKNVSSNWCKECNTLVCGFSFIEESDTHLWCKKGKGGHYVCFKNRDDINPCKKKDSSYNKSSWVCKKHSKKKKKKY